MQQSQNHPLDKQQKTVCTRRGFGEKESTFARVGRRTLHTSVQEEGFVEILKESTYARERTQM